MFLGFRALGFLGQGFSGFRLSFFSSVYRVEHIRFRAL